MEAIEGTSLFTTFIFYRDLTVRKLGDCGLYMWEMLIVANPYTIWKSEGLFRKCLLWLWALKTRYTITLEGKKNLLRWVKTQAKGVSAPTNFKGSWRDGITLCALMESLAPGSCPRYELLNPDNGLGNTHIALKMVEKYLEIEPLITVSDIIGCRPDSDIKLTCLISQLKLVSNLKSGGILTLGSSRKNLNRPTLQLPKDGDRDLGVDHSCIAKGMGLMVAVKGKKASFNIFLNANTSLDLVIEIRGPKGTLCTERITSRSPKKKIPIKPGAFKLERNSWQIEHRSLIGIEDEINPNRIPFEYEVQVDKIVFNYIPLWNGKHKLSIICQGHHMFGSPYSVSVGETIEVVDTEEKPPFKLAVAEEPQIEERPKHLQIINQRPIYESDMIFLTPPSTPVTPEAYPVCGLCQINENSMQDVSDDYEDSKPTPGAIIRRRVLRHVLVVDGKEVIIEDTGPQQLALAVQAIKEGTLRELEQMKLLAAKAKVDILDKKLTPLIEVDLTNLTTTDHLIEDRTCSPLNRFASCTESEISSMEIETEIVTTCPPIRTGDSNFHWVDLPVIKSNPTKIEQESCQGSFTSLSCSLEEGNVHSIKEAEELQELEKVEMECNPPRQFEMDHQNNNERSAKVKENEEWLVIAVGEKSKDHSLTISDQKYSTNEEAIPDKKELETTSDSTVINRKMFFENLLRSNPTTSKQNSPLVSPTKLNKPKELQNSEVDLSANINLRIEDTDYPNEISPAFQKAKDFWEKSSSSEDRINRNQKPTVTEEEQSVRTKLGFWQSLTDDSIKTEFNEFLTRSHQDISDEQNIENKISLESPRSEETIDSGVFISHLEKPQTTRRNSQETRLLRSRSDPGKGPFENQEEVTTPLPKATSTLIYCRNPLFSLDFDRLDVPGEDFGERSLNSDETEGDRGYIDDEIPDYASILMDRYISFTGLLDNDYLLSRQELIGMNRSPSHELQEDRDTGTALLPRADQCFAFGAALHYAQVQMKNSFQVKTIGAGKGCLTVSVQGPGEHDVAEVIVTYVGQQTYEVMYEVLEPGYYIISVKWSEWNIPDSPFICKVTY